MIVAVIAVLSAAVLLAAPPRAAAPVGARALGATEVETPRVAAVGALLDRWATATRSDDQDALTGLLDPSADPDFVRAERARAAALVDVPLAEWGYELRTGAPRTTPPGLAAAVGADEVWAPPVELRYAIAGADEESTYRSVGAVLVRRGAEWRLLGDTVAGVTTWRGLWDFGPVVSLRTPQGVVLAHPVRRADMVTLSRELATAVPAVSALWGTSWSQRALILLPESPDELRALIGRDFASPGVAAVTISDVAPAPSGAASGVRVVFNPETFDEMAPATLRVVLRHELTHAATRSVTVSGAPLWMLEGYADYVGYRGTDATTAEIAPGVARRVRSSPDRTLALPADADFAPTGPSEDAQLAYEVSWTMSSYLAQTYGEAGLTRLYRTVAAAPPTPGTLDAAFTGALGIRYRTAVRDWRRWLRHELG